MTQLTNAPAVFTGFTCDLNGNLTGATDASGTATYTWNARNQLTAITAPAFTASFAYDALGRRTTKVINGAPTQYLYDGLNVVQEKNGAAVTANLLTGLGIDDVLTRTDGAGTRGFLTDALGSTIALVDNTGAVLTQYTYEPFGAVNRIGAASQNSYTFTGREDDGSGLYYYRARYYHPRLQRFISKDPIGIRGGDLNLYAYARNNPVILSDPLGLLAPPAPSSSNICADIREIQSLGWLDIIRNFKEGGKWDFKFAEGKKYEAYGNYHYGVLMRARGLSVGAILRGAGAYQLGGDTLKGYGWHNGEGWPWGDPPYGDFRDDQLWIREDITDFDGAYYAYQCQRQCGLF